MSAQPESPTAERDRLRAELQHKHDHSLGDAEYLRDNLNLQAERDRLRADYEELKSTHIDKTEAIRAEYMGQYLSLQAAFEALCAELTAEARRAEDAHGEAQRWALQVESLRAGKAGLVAALQAIARGFYKDADGYAQQVGVHEATDIARAALAEATATEGGDDDGADPTTREFPNA
jgi:hypothetical protein